MIELFNLLLHVDTMSRYARPAARLIHREQPKKVQWKNSFFTTVVGYVTVAMLDTAKGKLQMCKLSMDDTPESQEAGKIFE